MRLPLLFVCLFLLRLGTASAALECPIPVADIPKKLAELKGMDRDARYKYFNCLIVKHAATTSRDELLHLKELGIAASKMLFAMGLTELEDYDLREAIDLADKALIALVRRMESPSAAEMLDDYAAIHAGSARFKLLQWMRGQVAKLDDLKLLAVIVDFAEGARIYSEKHEATEDERDYISREALMLQQEASSRLITFSPTFEGVFEVTLTCRSTKCLALPGGLRFTVTNTLGSDKIVASLVNPQNSAIYFLFPNCTLAKGGRTLRGSTRPGYSLTGIPGQFSFHIDLDTGEIEGTLRESDSPGYFDVAGEPLWSTSEYFRDALPESPATAEEMTGRFTSVMVGEDGYRLPGELHVRHFTHPYDRFVGAFRSTIDVLGFQLGNFVSTRSLVNLIYSVGGDNYIHWVLANRGDRGWRGHGYSSLVGRVYRLELERTGDIPVPPRLER